MTPAGDKVIARRRGQARPLLAAAAASLLVHSVVLAAIANWPAAIATAVDPAVTPVAVVFEVPAMPASATGSHPVLAAAGEEDIAVPRPVPPLPSPPVAVATPPEPPPRKPASPPSPTPFRAVERVAAPPSRTLTPTDTVMADPGAEAMPVVAERTVAPVADRADRMETAVLAVASAPIPSPPAVRDRPSPGSVPPTAAASLHPPRLAGGNRPPSYPMSARRRGLQGIVLLKVVVGADGRAESIAIQESSGFPVLDAAAREAVQDWRFHPGRRGDRTMSASLEVPVRFDLRR